MLCFTTPRRSAVRHQLVTSQPHEYKFQVLIPQLCFEYLIFAPKAALQIKQQRACKLSRGKAMWLSKQKLFATIGRGQPGLMSNIDQTVQSARKIVLRNAQHILNPLSLHHDEESKRITWSKPKYCFPTQNTNEVHDIKSLENVWRMYSTVKVTGCQGLYCRSHLHDLKLLVLQRRHRHYSIICIWKILNAQIPRTSTAIQDHPPSNREKKASPLDE